MVKPLLVAGSLFMLVGVAAAAWPDKSVTQPSRKLVPTRTYERRGPTVYVHGGFDRVRLAGNEVLSAWTLLSADGYWVRARPGYLTRERLRSAKVLVVDRPWNTIGDWRTATMLSRWIQEGGSVLVLAKGEGPEARHALGLGRVAVIDAAAYDPAAFVERLLDAMHWLDDGPMPGQQ
jgi:hypothetical protein